MTDTDNIQVNHPLPTRVLVIEDDEAMNDLLQLVLNPDDYQVSVVSSGQQGVQVARQLAPDIILIDLMASDMDGMEVCRALREFTRAPILVLAAVSKPAIVAQALDSGADDYLLKPMTSSVLVAHIRRMARRARPERDHNNGFGPFSSH